MRAFLFAAVALASGCVDDHRAPKGGTDAGSDNEDCETVDHDVSIRNENDAEALPQSGCWDLYGKLTIEGSAIKTLSMLGDIRSANDIEISGTGLTSFDTPNAVDVWYGAIKINGNQTLTSVGNLSIHDGHVASVLIDQNPKLASFELGGLDSVDTDLTITNNAALTAVDISTLETVGGKLTIDFNGALATVGLGTLTQTNGVEVMNNSALTSLHGLPTSTVFGDLVIQNNPLLSSVTGLSALQRIGGNLKIDSNNALTSLAFIPSTSAMVQGQMVISNNTGITDLGGLSHFNYLGGITVTGNTNLAYCPAHEVAACVPTYGGTPVISNNKSGTTTNCGSVYWCQ